MLLSNDTSRCAGIRHTGETCPMRNSCERAMQFFTDQERVVKSEWLCQSPEFEMRIRPEVG